MNSFNMAKKKTKSMKKKTDVLEQINEYEAFEILRILSEEDKQVRERIEEIAWELLRKVDLEDVAEGVYFELNSLEVEEVWDQSGSTRNGYVDPTEKAWEMFEEALEPFIEELRKYQKLSMDKQAKTCCIGILRGIYQFEKESTSEFKDWAVDAPKDYFESVLKEWKKGQKDTKKIDEIDDFIKKKLPDW